MADVLHICHDSESGIGLQRFGVEGPSHYDEIAVYEIQHRRCLPCGYLRARTVDRRSHGFRVTRPRFQGGSIIEFTASFAQLFGDSRVESHTRGGADRSNRVRTVGRPWTHRHSSIRAPGTAILNWIIDLRFSLEGSPPRFRRPNLWLISPAGRSKFAGCLSAAAFNYFFLTGTSPLAAEPLDTRDLQFSWLRHR